MEELEDSEEREGMRRGLLLELMVLFYFCVNVNGCLLGEVVEHCVFVL